MKISYAWLKDFIEIEQPAEEIGEMLTDLGLEVEGIEDFESVKGGLKGVVVGKVLTCKKHPNADRLKITTVDVGGDEILKIVCGAPNIAKGLLVPVALIGTTLYDKEQGAWEIKKSKIRGEESFGMICAEDELGLGESHDGIMILDDDLKPGTPLTEIFEVLIDKVFEIGLTPNRCDAMSHYGVARDLRAGLLRREINKTLETPSSSKFRIDNHTRKIPVFVEDSERALRYCSITMTGIKVQDSPLWLQNRLKSIGLSPINNIVDATNYVMHALGQPFHAFDADKIQGQKVFVKTLKEGTKFTTLDEVERSLSAEDLMICDEDKPLCIAGVYGGLDSGITRTTTSVFLESAYFNPVSIRKTAKRHGLNTDASFRFERGIDPEFTEYALKRLVLVIQEISGGTVSGNLDDFYPKKIEGTQVFLRYKKINELIGQEIDPNVLKSILASLNIRVHNITESGMGLTVPPFRADVEREVDVVEEILRVFGYNNIKFDDKLNATIAQNFKYGDFNIQNIVGNQLVSQGFFEIMNNSLTRQNHLRLKTWSNDNNVELLNPLSRDLSVMRQSLLQGGLESLAYNLNRHRENLRFFEFGKTYHKSKKSYEEHKHLSLFITGKQQYENWNSDDNSSEFFYLKGILNAVFQRLGLDIKYKYHKCEVFSESLEIYLEEKNIGCFGVLKKSIITEFDIEQEVLYADINWDVVLKKMSKTRNIALKPIPKFPSVRRDFALLLDENISFDKIEEIAYEIDKKFLKEVGLFDVYQGKNLPEGKKSYAVSFTFRDDQKTLTDKQIDKVMAKLREKLENELEAELR